MELVRSIYRRPFRVPGIFVVYGVNEKKKEGTNGVQWKGREHFAVWLSCVMNGMGKKRRIEEGGGGRGEWVAEWRRARGYEAFLFLWPAGIHFFFMSRPVYISLGVGSEARDIPSESS